MKKNKKTSSISSTRNYKILGTKYSNIIIPVFLMLVITISVLGGIYWLSKEINQLHTAISYANKQTTNVQNLKNSVYNIDLYTQELKSKLMVASENEKGSLLEHIRYELFLLDISQKEIDKSIQLFTSGGEIKIDNQLTKIIALQDKNLQTDIKKAKEYWQPYQRLIFSFQRTLDTGAINSETIRFASDYARIFSDSLYYEFSDIGEKLQDKVDKLNNYMQLIMIIGLTIAILLFSYIIFISIRQLLSKDAALELARQETSDIMRTVKDGLFLVYPDYRISHEYSSELSSIIKQEKIGGQLLHDLMAHIVSPKDIEVTEEFIDQLFNTKVVEDLIDDLNPLDKIKVNLTDKKGRTQSCHLSFKFSRVYEGKKISRVLVSVRDISEEIELERKLQKERQQHDEELEMLASILHTDAISLNDFIRSAQNKTQQINNILKISTAKGTQGLKEKAEQIFRQVHSLKGEASALKLNSYVALMERFERFLRELRERSALTGNDFLPLVVDLDQLIEFNEKIKNLNQSLRQKSSASEIDPAYRIHNMTTFFKQFANDIAERNERKVEVQCHGLQHFLQLSQTQQDTVKELIIQLLRNAIVHGIEYPQDRQSVGKKESGNINIHFAEKEGQLTLNVQDDGRGIDYQKLRQKAIAMNVVSEAEAKEMSSADLVKFMLRPGVSTMANGNEDAGQGVGSDIIVSNVKALQGRLRVHSQSGKLTRFTIVFPL